MTLEVPEDRMPTPNETWRGRRASILDINFSKVADIRQAPSGRLRDPGPMRGKKREVRPITPDGKLLTPKQIRARARRKFKRGSKSLTSLTVQEFEALYKPIDEWDIDELAKGRPRDKNGGFAGGAPEWITREIHEKAMERFVTVVKGRMGEQAIGALDTLEWLMQNNAEDQKGKPIVPASTKLQAATFLLEHVVGKPKQHIEQDISVKLQSILGTVMVNPNTALAPPSQGGTTARQIDNSDDDLDVPAYTLGHFPGHTIPMGAATDIEEGEWTEDE